MTGRKPDLASSDIHKIIFVKACYLLTNNYKKRERNLYEHLSIHARKGHQKKGGEIIETAPRCISASHMYILLAASKAGKTCMPCSRGSPARVLTDSQLRQSAASLQAAHQCAASAGELSRKAAANQCSESRSRFRPRPAWRGLRFLQSCLLLQGTCSFSSGLLSAATNANDWALLVPSGLLPRGQVAHTDSRSCSVSTIQPPGRRIIDRRLGRH
ncbi:hypothetical protein PVAP13_1KG178477 [Panicum virgatum]|uniref:Uncharacterized protein n=1 Tax=Panicum virgatum TaxID=38727 RepID=A0A8T0XB75_PANVG|nr:hypothetical protein PVAP13_1KG178477 [Panicum virgatum]